VGGGDRVRENLAAQTLALDTGYEQAAGKRAHNTGSVLEFPTHQLREIKYMNTCFVDDPLLIFPTPFLLFK
jgi:hypothetical protein